MESNHFKRYTDISVSAFLSVRGHKLLGVEGSGRQAFFVFESTPELERDELAYLNRGGTIDALTYSETLRNFKALVTQRDREGDRYGQSNHFTESR